MTTSNSNGSPSPAAEDASLADSINRLLHKMDSLESKVNMLQRTVQEAPGMAAMATDIIDEALRNASASGVDVNTRIKNTAHMAYRLTDESTMASLQKIVTLSQEAPGLISMVADILDSQIRNAAASGIDIEARIQAVKQLLIQLTDPSTMHALQQGLTALSDAPGLISMATDMVDEQIGSANSKGVDLGSRIKSILTLAHRLSDPDTTAALEHILEPRAVEAVGALGTAIAESKNQPHKPVGPLGLMKALRDPDVQRATSYLVEIGKRLGQELK